MITRCPDCKLALAIDRIGDQSTWRRVLVCVPCRVVYPVEPPAYAYEPRERRDLA